MAKLDIGGQQVEVGDEFLKLSPADQASAVEEIAAGLPKAAPAQPPSQWELFKAGIGALVQDPRRVKDLGLVQGVADAVNLPREASEGKLPAFPSDYTEEQGLKVANLAGLAISKPPVPGFARAPIAVPAEIDGSPLVVGTPGPEMRGATERLLKRALPENTPERLAELGPDASLADVSPSMQGLGQGVASKPGPASETLVKHLKARDQGTNQRLLDEIDTLIGPDEAPATVQANLEAAKAAAITPDIQAGYGGTVNGGNLAERPAVAGALRQAADAAANEGSPLPMVVRDEAGNVVPSNAAETFAAGSRGRIDRTIGDLLGFRGELATAAEIEARRKAEAGPFYERGFKAPIDYDSEAGQRLLDLYSRIPGRAKAAAREILGMEGRTGISPRSGQPVPKPDGLSAYGQTGSGGPKPDSLSRFIARNGGLSLDGGDAAAAGLDRINIRGVGKLAHEKGRSIDGYWRDRLIEEGYLPRDPDGGQARDITGELYNLLERDLSGDHVYPEGYQERGRARMTREDRDHLDALKGEVVRDLIASGRNPQEINPAVLDDAAKNLGARMAPTGSAAYDMAAAAVEAAPEAPRKLLTARHWDYIKRGLDTVIEDNTDAMKGGVNTLGRAATALKNELLDALNAVSPDLARGRSIWRDESTMLDALDKGRDWFSSKVTREQVARDVAGMSEGERELARLGFANAARETLANAATPHTAVSKPAFLEKLELIAGREAGARFRQTLANERQAFTESMVPNAQAWKRAYDILKDKAARAKGPEADGLAKARDDLRAVLAQNPDFARAFAKSEYFDRVSGAADLGRKIFDRGDNPVRSEELAAQWLAMLPGERAALFKGARSKVGDLVRTKSNDLLALKHMMGGEGDYAGRNAATVFGDEAAQGLVNAIDREAQKRETFQAINPRSGSQTQLRAAGSRLIDEASTGPEIVHELIRSGGLAQMGIALTKFAYKGMAGIASDATRADLARIFTLPAAERDAVVAAILKGTGKRSGATGKGSHQSKALLDAIATQAARLTPAELRSALQAVNDNGLLAGPRSGAASDQDERKHR